MAVRVQSVFHASWGCFSLTASNPLKQFLDMLSASRKDRHFPKLNALNVHHMHQDLDEKVDERKTDALWQITTVGWQDMLERVHVKKEQAVCRERRQKSQEEDEPTGSSYVGLGICFEVSFSACKLTPLLNSWWRRKESRSFWLRNQYWHADAPLNVP